jgi:hypothetical protein
MNIFSLEPRTCIDNIKKDILCKEEYLVPVNNITHKNCNRPNLYEE